MNQVNKDALVAQAQGQAPSSEATMIEQSRAIAQVQGALIVARQQPRDQFHARNLMEEVCRIPELANLAFFRFSRGGAQVSGPSIHLATELARCWGNVDYGIAELRRDAEGSEMLAYAWDLERNTRVTNTFIVPHKRDKRGGPVALVDMRDIYENNANAGARRLRECILRILPKAYVEQAKTICTQTMKDGGGEPLEQRREKLLVAFKDLGVTRHQIEQKIGHKADQLTGLDIGALRVIYGSIQRGEVTVSEEFDTDTGSEVAAQLQNGQADNTKSPTPAATAPIEPYVLVNPWGEVSAEFDNPVAFADALCKLADAVNEGDRATLSENNQGQIRRLDNGLIKQCHAALNPEIEHGDSPAPTEPQTIGAALDMPDIPADLLRVPFVGVSQDQAIPHQARIRVWYDDARQVISNAPTKKYLIEWAQMHNELMMMLAPNNHESHEALKKSLDHHLAKFDGVESDGNV